MSLIARSALPTCRALSKNLLAKPAPSAVILFKRDASTGNYTPIWTAERALSAGLLGIVPAALCCQSPATDFILAVSLTAHMHWGLEAMAVDYVRPRVMGELLPKLAMGSVYALSFATLGGLMYFNFTDVGLAQAVKMLWQV